MPRDVKIQSRRGTASEWISVNPVLALGELGVETDTHKIKAGDDETSWNDLPYVTGPVDGDNVSLQVKRDTDANLSALTDPFLIGQFVYGQTTGKTVIGDGESLFDELPDLRTPQSNTIIIAASNVSTSLKAKANYVCDGTNDATVFQTALAALPTRGTLKAFGNFVITSEITLGWYQHLDLSEAYFDNSQNTGYCFRVTIAGTYGRNVFITGGRIHGGYGGICVYGSKDCTFRDIYIDACEIGFDIDGYNYGTWYNNYINISVNDCTDKGMYIHTSGSSITTTATIIGGKILNNNYGVYVTSGNGHNLHGVNIESSTIYNIYCDADTSLYGCRIEDTGKSSIYANNGNIFIYESRMTGAYLAGTIQNIHLIHTNGDAILNNIDAKRFGKIIFLSNTDSLQTCINNLTGGEIVYLSDSVYSESITFPSRLNNVLFIGKGGYANNLNGTYATINGGDGPAIQFTGTSAGSIRFIGVAFSNNSSTSPVINLTSGDNWCLYFDHCVILATGKKAVYTYHGDIRHDVTFFECKFTGRIESSATVAGSGIRRLIVNSCVFNVTDDYAINLSRVNFAKITDCEITSSGTNSIRVGTGVLSAAIYNNIVNTPILNLSTNPIKIYNNPGYITENTGTATISASATSVTISHGLVATPTRYSVTPSANIGNCWIDTITATEMTIHCSTAPEADTAVSWSAQVV